MNHSSYFYARKCFAIRLKDSNLASINAKKNKMQTYNAREICTILYNKYENIGVGIILQILFISTFAKILQIVNFYLLINKKKQNQKVEKIGLSSSSDDISPSMMMK